MHYRQSLCKLLLRVHKCELTAYDTYCASHYLYIGRNVHRLYYAVGRARKLSSTIVFGSVDTVDLNSRKKKKIETEMMHAYVSLKQRYTVNGCQRIFNIRRESIRKMSSIERRMVTKSLGNPVECKTHFLMYFFILFLCKEKGGNLEKCLDA